MILKNNGTRTFKCTVAGIPVTIKAGEEVTLADNHISEVEALCDKFNYLEMTMVAGGGSAGPQGEQGPKGDGFNLVVPLTATVEETQEIIDSAPVGSTIILQARTTTYGDLILKPRVNLMGLQASLGTHVRVSSLMYAVEVGANATSNEVVVSNMVVSPTADKPAIHITGAAPYRLRLTNVNVTFATASSAYLSPLVKLENNASGSSVQAKDSLFHSQQSNGATFESVCPWLQLWDCTVTNSGMASNAEIISGLYHIIDSQHECPRADYMVKIHPTASMALFSCEMKNTVNNGTGIYVNNGGKAYLRGGYILDVKEGSGFTIDGEAGAIVGYDAFRTAHIPTVNPRNVKIAQALEATTFKFIDAPTFA